MSSFLIAAPAGAQEVPVTSQPTVSDLCSGCFAYLEFPPQAEALSSLPTVRQDALPPATGAKESPVESPAHAQPVACGGDYVCIADDPAAETAWAEKRVPQLRGQSAAPVPAALTKQHRCIDANVVVTAVSEDDGRLACSAANQALRLLGRCEISLRRPLHVQIMSEVRHPFNGAIFGLFDTKQERVLVTQEANIPTLVKDTPYADLPLRDFYRSLIVHEVVHGVMHQNLKRAATSHAAYEYPAYALQVDSLPPQVRDAFLQSFDQAAIAGKSLFNDPVLFFDPYFFAASAYHHFKATNGCAHLIALLEGEVAFIAPPHM